MNVSSPSIRRTPLLLLGVLLAARSGIEQASAHPGHGKNHGHSHPLMLPFVERVDAQPLRVQCEHLAEALQAIGAPLPAAALAALRDSATRHDDANEIQNRGLNARMSAR